MRQFFDDLKIRTHGHSMNLIIQAVGGSIQHSGIPRGTCQLSALHTSASLVVRENSSTDVHRSIGVLGSSGANGGGSLRTRP